MASSPQVLDPELISSETSDLENKLKRLVVGQDEAVRHIVDAYQMYVSGLTVATRPISNFLFLGPTGSGKTRIVEALGEVLLNNSRAVTKVDCSEFSHSHEIAKLLGSPPGYLGHRESGARLSQKNIDQYQTKETKINFVLFDEVEKASDALWNLLLGIMDKAILTIGDNTVSNFDKTMIFLTSNLGAKEMGDLLSPKWGYVSAVGPVDLDTKVNKVGNAAAKKKFTPEFINRLDRIVTFHSLTDVHLKQILDIEISQVQMRLISAQVPVAMLVTSAVKKILLEEGTDLKYGARPLKRVLENRLVQPISRLIGTGQLDEGDVVHISYKKGKIVFVKDESGLDKKELVGIMDLYDIDEEEAA